MQKHKVTGVVLAGGQGSRMGGVDKGWVTYQQKALIEHVLARLSPQVDEVLIVANRNQERYAALGVRVVEDVHAGFQGPLVGILTGLQAAQHDQVVFAPCDGPFLPLDLVDKFQHQLQLEQQLHQHKPIVVAKEPKGLQPMLVMMEKSLLSALKHAIERGERKPDRWYAQEGMCSVLFAPESLRNFNRLDDLHEMH